MTGHSVQDPLVLPPHRLKVALLQPQIAPNTGNIGRLCVATGSELHLVRPLGFVLSDQKLRRSGMDYWDRLQLTIHDDTEAFFRWQQTTGGAFWLLSTKGGRSLWEASIGETDCLILGSETAGIDAALIAQHPGRVLRIPQVSSERCLNLSTAAGIALYEALRQANERARGAAPAGSGGV
jgi:tRNA (cytidine/uridine-2'-O-)-methyltransferase